MEFEFQLKMQSSPTNANVGTANTSLINSPASDSSSITVSPNKETLNEPEEPQVLNNELKVVEFMLKKLSATREHYKRKYLSVLYQKNSGVEKLQDQVSALQTALIESGMHYEEEIEQYKQELVKFKENSVKIGELVSEYCKFNSYANGRFWYGLSQFIDMGIDDKVAINERESNVFIFGRTADVAEDSNGDAENNENDPENNEDDLETNEDDRENIKDEQNAENVSDEKEQTAAEVNDYDDDQEKEANDAQQSGDSEKFEDASDAFVETTAQTVNYSPDQRDDKIKCGYCVKKFTEQAFGEHLREFHKVLSPKELKKIIKKKKNKRVIAADDNNGSGNRNLDDSDSTSDLFVKPAVPGKRLKRSASTFKEANGHSEKKMKI